MAHASGVDGLICVGALGRRHLTTVSMEASAAHSAGVILSMDMLAVGHHSPWWSHWFSAIWRVLENFFGQVISDLLGINGEEK